MGDAPGSNGPAQLGPMLKAKYASTTKKTKPKPGFNKIRKMLGSK